MPKWQGRRSGPASKIHLKEIFWRDQIGVWEEFLEKYGCNFITLGPLSAGLAAACEIERECMEDRKTPTKRQILFCVVGRMDPAINPDSKPV